MDEDGLVRSRAKRQKIDKNGKAAALERLKLLKGSKNKYEIGELENVYDYIDEKEYSKRVLQRQDEDWLENPGDGYFEDGREIFDEEEDSSILDVPRRQSSSKKSEKQKPKKSSKSIIQMVRNMPEKKKSGEGGDNILCLLENTLNPDTQSNDSNSNKSDTLSSREYLKRLSNNTNSRLENNKKEILKPLPDGRIDKIEIGVEEMDTESIQTKVKKVETGKCDQLTKLILPDSINKNCSTVNFTEENVDMECEELISSEVLQDATDENESITMDVTTDNLEDDKLQNALPVEEKEDLSVLAKDFFNEEWEPNSQNINISLQNVSIDKSDLPLTTNKNGERVFRFFWWDSYEDPIKQPGVVYIFGKVYYEKKKIYLSCCVIVENIQRRVFLLPREKRFDTKANKTTDTAVTLLDVYQEFNEKVATPNKIMNFKSRKINLKYAFDLPDVPIESEYLEVKYSASYGKLSQDLSGETFSRVFGTNTSSMELLLLERKIKGPCWLEVKNPQAVKVQNSWCKLEARCLQMEDLSVSEIVAPPPPMVLMAINIRSVVNNNMGNEIVMIGVLVQTQYKIDKPAPKPSFNSHFCSLTRSNNLVWPQDLEEFLAKYKKTEVVVHQAEKSLLNHFLTKLFTIDPDVIIGHDLFGFTLDTLIQRIQHLKIPNWSRMGRLRRAIIPQFKGKQVEKSITCGRLVCDVVTSARELIRARSYDLSTLCKQILGVDENARQDFTCEEIIEKFEKSRTVLELIEATMGDANYILKIIYEMNVLPLALQITKIAGCVLSKTLLGGRSERNEYLLLHAFTEKNYLVPDKSIKKFHVEDETTDENARSNKKKPQYTGGLVLEPKKGFYDKFILLMDFNSLYPSIIQEYNICFTTISRDKEDDEKSICFTENQPLGILPIEIQKLVETRREVKALMKAPNLSPETYMQHNIRQMALKLTANSMYGCLGFSFSRFYAKPLAALVTSKGREILMNTKNIVEKMNYDVIYGDTDSIMINTNCLNYDDVFIVGQKIKEEINKLYKYIELEVDGVFKYMLLLKKKKYAAVAMTKKSNGQFILTKEYKGLDIVRRDWCQLSAEIGRHVLNQILSDLNPEDRIANIKEHLERIADDLRNRKVPTSLLAITKQLTKSPEDYSDLKSLPHLQVALRINSKGGKKLKAGHTVSYVICDNGSSLPAVQRAYHIDELKSNPQLLIDVKYYLGQQIHPVVNRLCEPIDGIDSAFIAECLGLDPSSYRKAESKLNSGTESSSATEDYILLNDLEAFKRCEPFSFVCKTDGCGTENIMDNPMRGDELALSKCRNPSCTSVPYEFLFSISNELTNKIRNYVSKFYENWMICEDPGCANRTQRVPMKFSSAFPTCTLCNRGIMYREFTSSDLHYQLKYYRYIFTLDRVDSEVSPTLRNAYKFLHDKVAEVLNDSAYNSLDLSKLFSKRLRKKKIENSFGDLKI